MGHGDVGSLFGDREEKLEKNVYGSAKGRIRLALLEDDLTEYCPGFARGSLRILDVGGGAGHFARICAGLGHRVLLCDSSQAMIEKARKAIAGTSLAINIECQHQDFLTASCVFDSRFELVLMHGSAEWMADPAMAIGKACSLVAPGGCLSLLIYNRDRLTLKQGINGMLVKTEGRRSRTGATNLTPPGAMTSSLVRKVLREAGGNLLLQSGIRIFYKFFREGVPEETLSHEMWLEQERAYYRQEPFNRLGEHSHFLWQAGR